MSNQRPGKVVRAIEPSMKDSGKEDEAFYFEQMEDWLKQGKSIPSTEEQTIKALGI